MENNDKKPSILALAVIIAIGFVFGIGGFTFWYANGFSYFSDDSKACNNCHVMNEVYKDWSVGSHKKYASCNDCHIPDGFAAKWSMKAQSGFNHGYAFTMKDLPTHFTPTQKTKEVVQENCIRCHSSVASNVINPTTSKIHNYDKSLSCVSCHKNVGHLRNF